MNARRVAMIGTDPATHGGISAALAAWEGAGLFDRWPVTYIATHRAGTRTQKALRAFDALVAFIVFASRGGPAVLHVHGASRASFWRKAPFMAMAFGLRWPVVFHLHGGAFAHFYERECGRVRRALVRLFLTRAECLVAVSERWATWLRATFAHPDVVTIPNAVALPALTAPRSPTRIAFMGRISKEKGAFDLAQALGLLRDSHPAARAELAGEGDVDEFVRHAHALGVADRVLVRGWCEAPECARLLGRSGLFVLPSRFEGLPMSLLEAMAAGCAVIASRVGGIPDLVRDGENGLLVEAGDPRALAFAMRRLLDDPSLAHRLGAAARETVARAHAPALAAQRIGAIYSRFGVEPVVAQPQGLPA